MTNQPHSPSAEQARRSHILKTLITRHRPALMRQAHRHAARPADAEDALQEACLQFMRHYDGPPETDALRWMMVVTKRCAWALGRTPRRHEVACELALTDADGESGEPLLHAAGAAELDPAELTERAEAAAERARALAALKPDERTALVLFGAGLRYREIAERRRWTYTKVNRCLREGREALRQLA